MSALPLGHLGAGALEHLRNPIGVRETAIGKSLNLPDPRRIPRAGLSASESSSNRYAARRIAVVRKTDAAGVGDHHSGNAPNVGAMDMPVDGNRLAERRVNRLQLGIARFRRRRTPGDSRDWHAPAPSDHESARAADRAARRAALLPAPPGSPPPSPRSRRKGVAAWAICFANSVSDSGLKQHFIRIANHALPAEIANRSTISAGLAPPCGRSPPWRIKSGEVCRRSARTASNAVRLPWMSDTMAMRITVLP